MNDRDPADLDRRIRDLVAHAVADTPPSPRLDEGLLVKPTDQTDPAHDRSRWFIGGLAGLSIAAAIVAIFLFNRPDEVADPLVPATRSTISIVTPPSTAVSSTAPTTAATAAPSTDPAPSTAPTTVPQTTPPTTQPPVEPVERADVRLEAGPAGVEILGIDDGRVVTTEPMALARLGPDGGVYMQRTLDADEDGSDTRLLFVAADSSAPEPVELPEPLNGSLRLHDSAAVDGRWTVLLESVPPRCANPENCDGGIYVYWPDTGEVSEIASKIVWEGGWEQLSLSETGIIVGAETEGPARGPYIAAVPGATASPPTVEQLGLEANFFDCSDCPQGFTINRRGDAVAWIDARLDTGESTVHVVGIDGTPIGEASFSSGSSEGCCPNLVIPVVSLGAADVGGGHTTLIAIVNDDFVGDREFANLGAYAPVYVDIATGEVNVGPQNTRAAYE